MMNVARRKKTGRSDGSPTANPRRIKERRQNWIACHAKGSHHVQVAKQEDSIERPSLKVVSSFLTWSYPIQPLLWIGSCLSCSKRAHELPSLDITLPTDVVLPVSTSRREKSTVEHRAPSLPSCRRVLSVSVEPSSSISSVAPSFSWREYTHMIQLNSFDSFS